MDARVVATLATATLLASASAGWAQPALRVSQSAHDRGTATGCPYDQSVKVYLTAADGGAAATAIATSALSARLDNRRLTTASVTPFDRTSEGVLYIVLVDVSASLPRPAFEAMRDGLLEFVKDLQPADRMSLWAFGSQVRTIQPPTGDKDALRTGLRGLEPVEKETKLYQALREALPIRQVAGALPDRRAVLVVTDGKDEGSGWSADNLRDQIRQTQMPIYAVGWGPGQRETPDLATLRNFATISGGVYERAADTNVSDSYSRLQAAVRNVHVARFTCGAYENCPTDGSPHELSLTYTSGNLSTSASLPVLLPFIERPVCTQTEAGTNWWLIGGGIGALLLLGIVGLVVARRRGATEPVTPPPTPAPVPSEPTRPLDVRSLTPPAPKPPPPAPFKVACAVVHGPEPGREFAITVAAGTPAVVGRGATCAIRLERDPGVAERQFELQHQGRSLLLVNVAPRGGTRHNGVAIHGPVRLEDGDIVSAGVTDLRVRFAS